MTATTLEPQTDPTGVDRHAKEGCDAALAEAVGDAALVAVLRAKPSDERVPTSVWWLVAESLRTSVVLRRAVTTGLAHRDELVELRVEALLLTDTAILELGDETGVQPHPIIAEPMAPGVAITTLQRGILSLARMLVTHRATEPGVLMAALAEHHRSLRTAMA